MADSVPVPAVNMAVPQKGTPGSRGFQGNDGHIGGQSTGIGRQNAEKDGWQAADGKAAKSKPVLQLPALPNQRMDPNKAAKNFQASAQSAGTGRLNLKRIKRQ